MRPTQFSHFKVSLIKSSGKRGRIRGKRRFLPFKRTHANDHSSMEFVSGWLWVNLNQTRDLILFSRSPLSSVWHQAHSVRGGKNAHTGGHPLLVLRYCLWAKRWHYKLLAEDQNSQLRTRHLRPEVWNVDWSYWKCQVRSWSRAITTINIMYVYMQYH